MPRSPELRNLLDRTIAQLDNLNDAGVPATGRKIELYMIDHHMNSPCIEGIASAQPSFNQINAFRRREEPQASDAAIHMALNAFIGRMLTKERDIDACIRCAPHGLNLMVAKQWGYIDGAGGLGKANALQAAHT